MVTDVKYVLGSISSIETIRRTDSSDSKIYAVNVARASEEVFDHGCRSVLNYKRREL